MNGYKKREKSRDRRKAERDKADDATGQAVSRVRQRDKWESIGDMGGVICDAVEEATECVLKDPMGIFWR